MKILIVDDDVATCQGLAFALSRWGHDVAYVTDVSSALAALSAPPDLLVCDWQLEDADMDGIDVARLFSKNRAVKIVMVTARSLDDLKRRAWDLQLAGCFHKPVSIARLLDTITLH